MTVYDLTLLEFIVAALHSITAAAYLALGIHIMKMKRYLGWNKHIYPTMMYGAFVLSISLIWMLTSEYFYRIDTVRSIQMIFVFIAMMGIGYSVSAETTRIGHKHDRIKEKDGEISQLKGVIEALKKSRAIFLTLGIFLLVNCGGMKKEVQRLKELDQTKTEQYEKRISEYDAKIKEVEQRETTTKTQLQEKLSEISILKKERNELREQVEKLEKSDFSVENPVGPVKVTDAKGNQYEFEGGQGTKISNKSESSLKSTLDKVTESLSETKQHVRDLTQNIFSKDKTIKEKDAEIRAKNELIEKNESESKKLKESLSKEVTKDKVHWGWLIGSGMMLMLLLQVAWKASKVYLKTYIPWIK